MCSTILFFFNDTATTEIYTLSLHDALPILDHRANIQALQPCVGRAVVEQTEIGPIPWQRTGEGESRRDKLARDTKPFCIRIREGIAKVGSPVTAMARAPDHLDLFVTGTDGGIY